MSWWNQAANAARRWVNQADRALGGWVPGGGVPNPLFRPRPPASSPSSRPRTTSPGVNRPASSASTVSRSAPGVNSTASIKSSTAQPALYQRRPGFTGLADEAVYHSMRGIGSLLNNSSQIINGLPDPFKNTLRDSANILPLSANLFTRYALNLGGKGIKPPDWMVTDVNKAIARPDTLYSLLERLGKKSKSTSSGLPSVPSTTMPKYEQQYNVQMYALNRAVQAGLMDSYEAEQLRNLYERRRKEKTVMMFPYDWSNRPALDSGKTSIGHAFVKNGELVDTYDFRYGGQTIKQEADLRQHNLNPEQYHNAARRFAATTVDNLLGNQEDIRVNPSAGPGMDFNNAMTNFGRGITSVLTPSNAYNINIPIPRK